MTETNTDHSMADRVAVVTGAGAGLGRAEAESLAAAGAEVILVDLPGSADEAAAAINETGGRAHVVAGDVGERATADAVMSKVEGLGRLDAVVNNAGITRDKMLFNLSDEDWDLVVNVHLRGHFLLSRNAAAYWRAKSKESGQPVDAAVVNTASEAFLFGSPGQANYAAAKGAIMALTLSTARGLGRAGVRANAIAPRARTAMTAEVFGPDDSGAQIDPMSTAHVAPLVTYLASPAAARITGQLFVVYGGMVSLMAAPTIAQRWDNTDPLWDQASLTAQVGGYFAERDPSVCFAADELASVVVPAPKD